MEELYHTFDLSFLIKGLQGSILLPNVGYILEILDESLMF